MININKEHNFYKILSISDNFIDAPIPTNWKLILTSDGSFTQNLTSLSNQLIHVKIEEQYEQMHITGTKIIRRIWLEDENQNKLTFAQSLWYINKYSNSYLSDTVPIGQLFLQSGTDIYKNIEEIYCGYSAYLQYYFQSFDLIWGRKYKIYYKKQILATIQEFFPSHLIKDTNINFK